MQSANGGLVHWSPEKVLRFLPLILLPFLLTVIDDSWTFLAPTGFIDSYVYTGYFLDLQHLRTFAGTYYSSRLPWILVGNLAYTLAPVEIANSFLRLLLFYLGTFSLYIAVRAIWNNHTAALFSAILLGVHNHFLYAIHWDYVDGPSLTMLLVSFAFLARSTISTRPAPLLAASGFAASVALSIHFFVILLFPGLGVWYAWTHSTSLRRFFRCLGFICSGAVLAFVVFGVINKSFGDDFNFLRSQLYVARTLDTSPWKLANLDWVEFATWLAFPTIAVLVSAAAILLLLRRRLSNSPLTPEVGKLALAGMVMLLTSALFLFVELRRGLALQQNFYASFLIPFTFLVLGGGISVSMSRLAARRWLQTGMTLAVLLLSVGSFAASSFHTLPGCTRTCSLYGPMALALLGAAAGIGLSIASRNALVVILTFALMAIVNAAPDEYFPSRQQRDAMHDRFFMVYDANALLEPYDRDGQLRFWYSREEPLGGAFIGISSLHLWGYRLIGDLFPKLTNPLSGTDASVVGWTIALLTQDDDALSKADDTLKLTDLRTDLLFHDRVQRRDQAFNVFVIRVMPLDRGVDKAQPLTRSTDLSSMFKPVAGTVTSSKEGSVRIVGAATPWAYAAILRLPDQFTGLDGVSPIYVHVRLRVSGGNVGVGVLTTDGRKFIDQQEVGATTVSRDLYLRLPTLEAGHDLVIRTLSSPTVSDVRIESVSLSRVKLD